MNLHVIAIYSHSAKANLVTYQFVNTSTILDGCRVSGFAPKSVTLIVGQEQEVPHYVANGIFNFNWANNVKTLEKQLQAKAPAGQKRVWRAQAADLLRKVSELNVEIPVEPTGKFIGTVGEKIVFIAKAIECVHSREWTSSIGWRHTGNGWERPSGTRCMWRIEDMDGNIYMFSSSGTKINSSLEEAPVPTVLEVTVDEHKIYHDTRQTWIRNIKFNPGLFNLLNFQPVKQTK